MVDAFPMVIMFFQALMILFFGVFTEYEDNQSLIGDYPWFQDVNVMIFIGFGFLMTFSKKYGFSAVGYNFLIAAMVIQWSILTDGFFHKVFTEHGNTDGFNFRIGMNVKHLVTGDFGAGCVLITFGALLGKVSPIQVFALAIGEIFFYSLNLKLSEEVLKVVDIGGSLAIHAFGAFFGVIATLFITNKEKARKCADNGGSNYHSDIFAMIGTLFLWMFWPSFNGALAGDIARHRVVINTVLSLCASCTSAFAMSKALRHEGKFDMIDIQNATLAGGVAVGSSADLTIDPWGALLIGFVAGTVSTFGFNKITPWLEEHLGLYDTCGVLNLHGIPGILGGIAGAISAADTEDDTVTGATAAQLYPARDPLNENRSANDQAGYQALSIFTTLGIACGGAIVVGWIVSKLPGPEEYFSDAEFWEVPEEGFDHHTALKKKNDDYARSDSDASSV